jgi:RNA polymerase sigma-70 factor, ECF subfamily
MASRNFARNAVTTMPDSQQPLHTDLDFAPASSVLRKKDITAFGNLLECYRPMLREMARNLVDPCLSSKLDHSDIVQETYQHAVRGFPDLKAETTRQFFSWLRTLLTNNVLAARRRYIRCRKRTVRSETPLDTCDFETGTADEGFLARRDQNRLDEQLQRLGQAIQKLPDALQTVLKWRYVEGLTLREIGVRIERSEDAVRMLIKRCQTSLREQVFSAESS